MFRVEVALADERGAGWWVYGIMAEGDFNGDVKPDFSWYGGHDEGHEILLFLSSQEGYREVDLLSSIESAWRRLHPDLPPLKDIDTDDADIVDDIRLLRDSSHIMLMVEGAHGPDGTGERFRFSVQEADFAYVQKQ